MSWNRNILLDAPRSGAPTVGERTRGRGGHAGHETEIEVVTVEVRTSDVRLEVQSDTGKRYVLVLVRESITRSKCSCPSWVFQSGKLATKRGMPAGERPPCKHVDCLWPNFVAGQNGGARLVVPEVRRFRVLDL